jgi:two-component system alkaline phosphatase synthesis response regulator PhoP
MKNSDIKILLVDDEQDILEIISYNLKQEGYQVITATNGREAVEKATKR